MDSAGITAAIRQAAADWRSRRDAGLDTAAEAEFIAWLDADERHAIAFGEIEETFATLRQLERARPVAGAANPDLFARPAAGVARFPRRRRAWASWGLAAAAVVAVGLWLGPATERGAPAVTAGTLPAEPRRLDLPDGSVVELNDRSRVDVAFSAGERRVRLVQGEAYFTVAKEAARPFIVEARGVAVRAIGTAFCVHLQADAVAVLVAEGKVTVNAAPAEFAPHLPSAAPAAPLFLEGGHRVAIALPAAGAPVARPTVEPVSATGIAQALAWRSRPLEFVDAPLAQVVAEFNRYNRHQLIIADEALARQRFGGTFLPDAHATVVRLLELDFDVVAERGETETILRRRRP